MVFYGTILAMKLTQILDFRGAKYPFIILSMVLNVAWALIFFSLMDTMMQRYGDAMQGVDTSLMLGIFLGSLSIGFLMTFYQRQAGRHLWYLWWNRWFGCDRPDDLEIGFARTPGWLYGNIWRH